MRKLVGLGLLACTALTSVARAQSGPNWSFLYNPSPAEWQMWWTSKADYQALLAEAALARQNENAAMAAAGAAVGYGRLPVGQAAGTVAAGNDARIVGALPAASLNTALIAATLGYTPPPLGSTFGTALDASKACLNPKTDYHAAMDGVADDSTAMQNTINAASGTGRGCIDMPVGTLRATGLVVNNNNLKITCQEPGFGGSAGGTQFLAADLTSTVFTVSSVAGFYMRDCGFLSASRQAAGSFVDLEHVNSSGFDNVAMRGAYDDLTINDSAIIHFNHLQLRNWTHNLVNVGGNPVTGGAADLYFYNLIADEDDNTYSPNAGFHFTQSGGAVTVTNGDIIHAHNSFWVDPGPGQFVSWVYVNNTYFDSCDFTDTPRGGVGIKVSPHGGAVANGGFFNQPWSSTCTNSVNIGAADSISVATDYHFTDPVFLHDLQDAVVLNASDNTNLTNPTIAGGSTTTPNLYSGIVLNAGADQVTIKGGHSGGNFENYGSSFKAGLVLNAGFTGTLLADGINLTGNMTGAVANASAPSVKARIINSPGYNPVGLAAVAVGSSPYYYQAGLSPENINISGGTVSAVVLADPNGGASQEICSSAPCFTRLVPGQILTVTYSVLPTMIASKE